MQLLVRKHIIIKLAFPSKPPTREQNMAMKNTTLVKTQMTLRKMVGSARRETENIWSFADAPNIAYSPI